jgi:alpha-ribazole phosphatase
MADTRVTRWWWVRHAPVTVNNGCVYGATDPVCDVEDAASFAFLASVLPRDAVWVTSHLARTHLTAAAIVRAGLAGPAEVPGAGVVIERDLAEQNFGDWHGMKYVDLAAQQAEAKHRYWLARPHDVPPGGESFVALMARVSGAVRRLNEEHAGRDIIAVTHGGTIKAALAEALDLHPEHALAFAIDNLSLTRLERYDGSGVGHGWKVVGVNQKGVG